MTTLGDPCGYCKSEESIGQIRMCATCAKIAFKKGHLVEYDKALYDIEPCGYCRSVWSRMAVSQVRICCTCAQSATKLGRLVQYDDDALLEGAIGNLGSEHEPPSGWEAKVLATIDAEDAAARLPKPEAPSWWGRLVARFWR